MADRPDLICINGRFLTQPLSGVQRFATEISAGLRRIRGQAVVTLVPPGAAADDTCRAVGRWHGHAWEQFELPRHAAGGILVNLGNTAPLRAKRQLVVLHDAGVFRTPQAYNWKFRLWYKVLQHLLARSGATIATVSEFSRREICWHLGLPPDRVAVIGEGAGHMHGLVAERGILARSGLAPGRFVLAVGNLAAHKNLAALGELAGMLKGRGMTLAIAGGLAAGAFRDNGGAGGIEAARALGRVSDAELKALYESAACFVFPSRYEGFGLPALEAMACGCPVVASSIEALREVCGTAALYCDPDSPRDIAHQVGRTLDEAGLADRLRAAATAELARHSWEKAAQRLDQVLESLARDPGGAAIPARRASACASR